MITHPAAGWRIREYQSQDRYDCEDVFAECVSQFTWLAEPQAAPSQWVDTQRYLSTWVAEVGETASQFNERHKFTVEVAKARVILPNLTITITVHRKNDFPRPIFHPAYFKRLRV